MVFVYSQAQTTRPRISDQKIRGLDPEMWVEKNLIRSGLPGRLGPMPRKPFTLANDSTGA